LIAVEFGSQKLSVERSVEGRVRSCLELFQKTQSFKDADNLRRVAFPSSVLYGSQLLGADHWRVEVLYNNLIHEGEGSTEAAALIDAVQHISAAIRDSRESAEVADVPVDSKVRRFGRD